MLHSNMFDINFINNTTYILKIRYMFVSVFKYSC